MIEIKKLVSTCESESDLLALTLHEIKIKIVTKVIATVDHL